MKRSAWWSVVFSIAMEFQINVMLQGNWTGFGAVIVLYALIGCATYHTFPFVARRVNDPGAGFWLALSVHGLAGLLIVEWGFMGHAPGSIREPLLAVMAQAGMFAWWCTIAAMPHLLEHPSSTRFRRQIGWLYGSYAIVSTALAARWGLAPVILLEPPAYCAFFWYYWRFGLALRTADPGRTGPMA